jgi:hypothetical protein
MPLCEIGPALPLLGLMLSALAVLSTLRLLLQLMTLETRQDITDELADIDHIRRPFVDHGRVPGLTFGNDVLCDEASRERREAWRQRCRLLLLAPSFTLVMCCAFALFLSSLKGCSV